MQRLLIFLCLSFIIGIVIGMSYPLPTNMLAYGGGLSLSLLVLSLMMRTNNNQSYTALFLLAGFIGGWTNFSWKIDTTSPYHLVHFADDKRFVDTTEVAGRIIKEPEIREYKTNLVVLPEYVKTSEEGKKIPISGGYVMIQLRPSMRQTYDDYHYGDYIVTKGVSLTKPQAANNPGIFDYQQFLRNNNVYGLMSIRKDYQLQKVMDRSHHNAIVEFALDLKKDLLWNIKKTMPYPESAFLGGVMLGLRQGLSREVQDEFRASGVAHVLAVSGLHVTIITALLFGLLSIFKVPRRFMAPPIIAGLIIFAIITGGRPSTLRAVIMNSIALISFCYLASNLRTSLLFGISAAAVIILMFTPMILFEASFLYSFTAVLSLAILTGPLLRFFNRYLTSLHAIFLFLTLLVSLGTVLVDTERLYRNPPFALLLLGGLTIITYVFRGFLSDKFRFSNMPYWFTSFTSAQMAIQLGLGPLNAFYFQKYSLAAPMANFLAIPLIGVNVQLGIIAGLLGFIPLIGDHLALVINAANYLGVKLFLGSASFFAHSVPYPDVTPPPLAFMLTYYLVLVYIAYRQFFHEKTRLFKVRFKPLLAISAIRWRAILAVSCLVLFALTGYTSIELAKEKKLEITVFDLSIFNMGGGSSSLIEYPDGKNMLIDGGLPKVGFGKRVIDWNMGQMVVGPVLRGKRIRRLDWVVLTNPDSKCSGGLPYLLDGFAVHKYVDTFNVNKDDVYSELDMDTFVDMIDDDYIRENSGKEFVKDSFTSYTRILETLNRRHIEKLTARRGDSLYSVKHDNKDLKVDVLHPPEKTIKVFRTMTNNSLVIKVTYGNFSCLFPALLSIDGEKDILAVGDQLKADVMIAPSYGLKGSIYSKFIRKVKPELVIIQTIPSRWQKKQIAKSEGIYKKIGCKTVRTDQKGAVIITSDGEGYKVKTML